MPDEILTDLPLPPNGTALMAPSAVRGAERREYRAVLEGEFEYAGTRFDAQHPYLRWTPHEPRLIRADPRAHRYEYDLTPTEGQSIPYAVQLDIDRLVDRYLVTPSEITNGISGSIRVQVVGLPAPFPWGIALGGGLPAALVVGAAGMVVRRRMLLAGLAPDLLSSIGRIGQKARHARQAVARRDAALLPLRERIDTLADAALPLARRVQDLRSAQRLDRKALESDIAALTHRLEALIVAGEGKGDSSAAYRETEATRAEKRKALARLDEMARAEALCRMRLEKIEAALDSAALTLHSVRDAHTDQTSSEEAVRRALDAEVTAVHEVARDAALRAEEPTSVQALLQSGR